MPQQGGELGLEPVMMRRGSEKEGVSGGEVFSERLVESINMVR
jgi:hypothetical protein